MNKAINNGYKHTPIPAKQTAGRGTIPAEWNVSTLDDVMAVRSEITQPSAKGQIKYVGLEHIDSGNPKLKRWGTEAEVRSSKAKFSVGNILYGKLRPYLDKVVLAEWEGICATDILVFRAKEGESSPEYLVNLLHTDVLLNHAISTTTGVNHPRTSWHALKRFEFGLPPLPEQRTIAAILFKIQQAIETQEKIIERTKELKKSLMAKLFTEGLQGEELKETEIGLMPKSWRVVKLGEVSQRRIETVNPLEHEDEIYIGLEHIESGTTRLKNHGYASEVRSSKNRFFKGDVLYGKLRPYLDKSVLVDEDGMSSSDILVFTGVRASSQFLVHLVHTASFLKHAIATTTGVNHPRTSWDALSRFAFGLPTREEQGEICKVLNALDDKVELAERKAASLRPLFKSMLHQLMTGQVRVNNVNVA